MIDGPALTWRDTVYLLYDLVLLASACFLIPYYLFRGVRQGKVRRGIRERLGFYTATQLAAVCGKKVLWIHAVSVGETRAAVPLLQALKRTYPDHFLVISNVTETGHHIAEGLPEAELCLFFPFDLSWVVKRVLRQVNPSAIVIVETEIWPNFIRHANLLNIPVILVNGRISDRSFPRYRLARRLVAPILDQISAFCMQTELDSRRIIEMGALPDRVLVSGNLKFDMQAEVPDVREREILRETFRLPEQTTVWVAGSTHNGEDEIIAGIYRELVVSGENIFLILVPRHPDRCCAILEMLSGIALTATLRSSVESRERPMASGDVLLVDSIGEMLKFYALADLIFVGGSLVPVGGHNVLEASLLEKPVLFGMHMHNFKEISRLLQAAGGGLQVSDRLALLSAVKTLLHDSDRRAVMGMAGYQLLQKNVGATERTLAVISGLVN
jgi:3-deoxy-D-manno-octulosonic-acid transferase